MKQKNIPSIFAYFIVVTFIAITIMSSAFATQEAVNLRTAGNFVILAKSAISTTGATAITGNIGVSPIDSTAITGFGLIADSSNVFATSSLVTGKAYAADYAVPTPTTMTTAVSDMQTAYTDAAGRSLPDHTELGAGNIDGMTLAPGLYKWGTGVTIPNGVTLSGGANDVWVFQIAQNLDVGNGAIITLSGGAQAKNIFWQVAGQTTIGTTASFKGIILDQTAIVLNTGATLNGRALAQTAVTLDANAVTAPSGSSVVQPPSVKPPIGCGPGYVMNTGYCVKPLVPPTPGPVMEGNVTHNTTWHVPPPQPAIQLNHTIVPPQVPIVKVKPYDPINDRNTTLSVNARENDTRNPGKSNESEGHQNPIVTKPSTWGRFKSWFMGLFGKHS